MGVLGLIGTAVGTYFGMPEVGAAIGGALDSATSGHGGGSSGGSPASAADPFASQRGQYQTQLSDFMKTTVPGQQQEDQQKQIAQYSSLDPNASNIMRNLMNLGGTDAGNQLKALTAPGATFNSSDPSYKFRFEQGQQAVQRSGAAKGLDGSGNILMALQDYGQGAASQEYGAQFSRLSSLSQQEQNMQQQQFGEAQSFNSQQVGALGQQFNQLGAIVGQDQNAYQNNYARLAQLAGANTGQPGQAGALLQSQQAGAAAYSQQMGSALGQQLQNWFGPTSSFGGRGGATANSISEITPQAVDSGLSFTPEVFSTGP